MADRGGVAHADEPTWSGGGVPESSLEALAASWRQGAGGAASLRAAAGAARVDATPPEGLQNLQNLQQNLPPESASTHPPARGRAEVRAPYADLIAPAPAQSPPAQSAPAQSNGVAYQHTNSNGYSTGSHPVLPPGYEPAPHYQPPQYEAPQYEAPQYEAPQYEAPQYEAPPQYEEPTMYHATAWPTHESPTYQPPVQQQPMHQQVHQEIPRQEAPWHEALPPEPRYIPEPPDPHPLDPPIALPHRVPGEPDVPEVPEEEVAAEPLAEGPPAETPELARIAASLRYAKDELGPGPQRPDGFDMQAVLAAVRGVPGVRDAQLRKNPGGVHTLRLELADDADPGRVSREVARLLKERMGLAAEPNDGAAKRPAPETGTRTAAQPRAQPAVPGPAVAPSHSRDPRRRHPVPAVRRAESGRPAEPARTVETLPAVAPPRPLPGGPGLPRVVIDQVEVTTQGLDAVVEVRLTADGQPAFGVASGPAVDGYVLRLAAAAAAAAIDEMLVDPDGGARGRCFVEHAAVVPFGSCEVAVVVLLMVCNGWVEQLAGSALVAGDPRQAMVRATLAAVNRRLEALLR